MCLQCCSKIVITKRWVTEIVSGHRADNRKRPTTEQTAAMSLNDELTRRIHSINQAKFIFQAMRNNYNIINVTALERLPEKHYAH